MDTSIVQRSEQPKQHSLFEDEEIPCNGIRKFEDNENAHALYSIVTFDRGGKITRHSNRKLSSVGKKYCKNCDSVKGVSEFDEVKGAPTSYCSECRKEHGRKRMRAKYAEERDEITRLRNKMRSRALNELGGKCSHCGYDRYENALNFHHVDPSQKKFNPVRVFDPRYKAYGDMSEINKCALLCMNCHIALHAGQWSGDFIKRDGLGWTLKSNV